MHTLLVRQQNTHTALTPQARPKPTCWLCLAAGGARRVGREGGHAGALPPAAAATAGTAAGPAGEAASVVAFDQPQLSAARQGRGGSLAKGRLPAAALPIQTGAHPWRGCKRSARHMLTTSTCLCSSLPPGSRRSRAQPGSRHGPRWLFGIRRASCSRALVRCICAAVLVAHVKAPPSACCPVTRVRRVPPDTTIWKPVLCAMNLMQPVIAGLGCFAAAC